MGAGFAKADEPRADRTAARSWRLWIGVCLGLTAVVLLARQVDWPLVVGAFRGATFGWVVAAIASVLVTLTLVSVRWYWVLSGHLRRPTSAVFVRTFESVVLGQAVNIVLPVRLGEGVRGLDAVRQGYALGRVAAATVLERVLDMSVLALVVFGGVWLWPALLGDNAGHVTALARRLLLVAAALGLAAGLVVVLVAALGLLERIAPAWADRSRGWRTRVHTEWRHLVAGAAMCREPVFAVSAVLMSVLIFVASATTNLLVVRAFDLPVAPGAAVVLLVTLQLGTGVVSVPGNLGIFHWLTVVTLGAYGVAPDVALAAAIVLHAVSLGPKLVLAAVSVRRHRWLLAGVFDRKVG